MRARPTRTELWRRGQRGWPADFPLVQFPNAPLLVALAASLFAAVTQGAARDVGRAAFYVFLGAWAWEELAHGANWFRRVLGAGGLVYVVAKVSAAFGA